MAKFSENTKPQAPEIKVSKNGYEIRSEILALANNFLQFEYSSKLQKSVDGEETAPSVPTIELVVETAQKMYDFVNQNKTITRQ